MAKITCCYGCTPPKRHLGCHDTCKEYLLQKAELKRIGEARRKDAAFKDYSTQRAFSRTGKSYSGLSRFKNPVG